MAKYGSDLRSELKHAKESELALPFIGVYDVFSATLAAKYHPAVFLSGYGFAASHYGLPDEGYIAWSDMVSYVSRVRHVLPKAHLLVDIDDGYGDIHTLLNATHRLEHAGATAVMFEDQQRPKKCGHLPGKEVVSLNHYVDRLAVLLEKRQDLFVLARTDVSSFEEGLSRVQAFANCGADAVMIEGLVDIKDVLKIREVVGDSVYIAINLIKGGKTGNISLHGAYEYGADIIIYSTPCLFVAQDAIQTALSGFFGKDSLLSPSGNSKITLSDNNAHLKDNQQRAES